jgi:hypothetical protein
MNATIRRTFALAVALAALPASLAFAATVSTSPLALPTAALELAGGPALVTMPAPELALVQSPVPEVGFAGVHYRPRSGGWGRRMDSQSVTQVHLGFFDPEGDASREFAIGVRGGPMIDPHVQLGVGVDWMHHSENTSTANHTTPGPGGVPITTERDIASASINLFPIMAFVQVGGDDKMAVIPYFGLAGGYEVMNLTAEDYETSASFDATYGGWGWQAWGGAAIPLSGQVRVNGELFVNTAELGRDVTDSTLDGGDVTYRERVKANGVGMRLGISWGF